MAAIVHNLSFCEARTFKHSEKLNIDAVENLSAVLGREF
jgi:hypothetical protein